MKLAFAALIAAYTLQASLPDILIFSNGEKLIGHLERSTDSSLTFKSDMAGEITVPWSKVKELHTAGKFAVVEKGVRLRKNEDASKIPQGNLSFENEKLTVGSAETVVSNSADVIDGSLFQREILTHPGSLQNWTGTVTAGAAVVEATQSSQTFTGTLHLERTVPIETWLDRWNRTSVNITGAYGILTQPNTPTVKTAIYHGDFERDEYLSPRFYGFAQAAFDHNLSQGLNLEENYGGGVGWTAVKRSNEELNLKASLVYLKENFYSNFSDQNLIASTFLESGIRKFRHGIVLHEQLSLTPAWNNSNAYSALGNLALTLPLYKRLNVTLGAVDSFLNNPAPGSRKNSLQITSGVTYKLQ